MTRTLNGIVCTVALGIAGFIGIKIIEVYERSIRVEMKVENIERSVADTSDSVKTLVSRVDTLFSLNKGPSGISVAKDAH